MISLQRGAVAMYSIYPTLEMAVSINTAEALARGCDPNSTTEWWPRFDHPTDGRSALQDGGVVSHEQLLLEGWFPPIEEVLA